MEKIPLRMFGIYDKDLKIYSDFRQDKNSFFYYAKNIQEEEVVSVEVVFILG